MEELTHLSVDPGAEVVPFIDTQDYVQDAGVTSRLREDVLSLLPAIRQQRSALQERWERYYNVWLGKHQIRLYNGQSDIYPRVAHKIVESFIAHVRGQLFPTLDTFQVVPNPFDPLSGMLAPLIQNLLKHDIEQAEVERKFDRFLRPMFIYGTTIVKSPWLTKEATTFTRQAVGLPTGQVMHQFAPQKVMLYEGPTFDVVDLLDFFIHPVSSPDIDSARIIMHELAHSMSYLRGMERKGQYFGVERLKDESFKPEANNDKDTRTQRQGFSRDDVPDKNVYTIQEIWCLFDLHGDGTEIPCKVVTCGDLILSVKQNPLMRQRPPFRAAKAIELEGSFYGMGTIELLEHYQYALNAITNQGIDAATYQSNPILGVDQTRCPVDINVLKIAPLAFWPSLGAPRDTFEIFRFPDTTYQMFQTAQLIERIMQDSAGSPAFLQGKVASSDKTATEINTAAAGASAGLASMVRNVEASVLSPLLMDWYVSEQQFRSVQSQTKINGAAPMEIAPEDLVADYSFRWRVSSQVPPMVQQQQQMQEGMQAAGAGGPQPGGPTGQPGIGGMSPSGGNPIQAAMGAMGMGM